MAITGLAEVVLNVRDMERSLRFYRDLLGLRVDSPPQMANPVFLRAGQAGGGLPALAVLVQLPADAPGFAAPRALHHLAFSVVEGDLDRVQRNLAEAGVDVRFGQHPTLGLRTMYAFDPDGNEVEFIAP
ncbi:MAG: VOC family protein [Chloroflexota bacterium]